MMDRSTTDVMEYFERELEQQVRELGQRKWELKQELQKLEQELKKLDQELQMLEQAQWGQQLEQQRFMEKRKLEQRKRELEQQARELWRELERELEEWRQEKAKLEQRMRELKRELDQRKRKKILIVSTGLLFVALLLVQHIEELTLTPEEKVARAEESYQAEKKAIEDAHEYELREARAQVKLAEIEAKQRALYSKTSVGNVEHDNQIAAAKAKLNSLQARGADYSKLSPTLSSPTSEPSDEQTRLILSGLWLAAAFFLQRLFEKLFKDKGYALLTVCAAGFLLAFFTANYFLLGGSVTGGLMGSVGERS